MNFVFEGRPSDSPFVESVWYTESHEAGSFISQAEVNWGMVLSRYEGKTRLTVRGPETKATPAESPAGAEFIGITFKLGTFMPNLPLKTIMDRSDLTLPDASSQSFWLNSSTWQFPTFENADTFVERLVREGLIAREPVVEAAMQGHVNDMSLRTVQYRFLHATGLTQATVRQIQRAQQAVALLRQGTSILDTVFEAGYFDQAHLTRSLKRFTGQTPTQIMGVKQG
jgi:AraC-like DNA-binding protein